MISTSARRTSLRIAWSACCRATRSAYCSLRLFAIPFLSLISDAICWSSIRAERHVSRPANFKNTPVTIVALLTGGFDTWMICQANHVPVQVVRSRYRLGCSTTKVLLFLRPAHLLLFCLQCWCSKQMRKLLFAKLQKSEQVPAFVNLYIPLEL